MVERAEITCLWGSAQLSTNREPFTISCSLFGFHSAPAFGFSVSKWFQNVLNSGLGSILNFVQIYLSIYRPTYLPTYLSIYHLFGPAPSIHQGHWAIPNLGCCLQHARCHCLQFRVPSKLHSLPILAKLCCKSGDAPWRIATLTAGWSPQMVVKSKGIPPKMAETFRLRIYSKLPR